MYLRTRDGPAFGRMRIVRGEFRQRCVRWRCHRFSNYVRYACSLLSAVGVYSVLRASVVSAASVCSVSSCLIVIAVHHQYCSIMRALVLSTVSDCSVRASVLSTVSICSIIHAWLWPASFLCLSAVHHQCRSVLHASLLTTVSAAPLCAP